MQNDNLPLVTVVICVYNAGDYLKPSVMSIIDQTYKNLDILIINDGSTDNCISTIDGIKDSRIRILNQENRGKPTALNRALKEMSGEFYAIQDADDISHPFRIESQVKCMLENPDIGAVYTGNDMIFKGRHVAPIFEHKNTLQVHEQINKFKTVAHDPTAMFRVCMVNGISYNELFAAVEGVDYMFHVAEKHPMMVLGKCLYSYRISWDSYTRSDRDPIELMAKLWKVKKQACIRRGLDPKEYLPPKPIAGIKLSNRDRDNDLASDYIHSVKNCRQAGLRWKALQSGLICWRMHPFELHYLKALIYALTPFWVIDYLQKGKSQKL